MKDYHDDGHTIADMSGVGGRIDLPAAGSRDVREELGDPKEQLMLILGTLRAALSLGMVYIIAFGIAILLMVTFWT